jgi:hypothetical protein
MENKIQEEPMEYFDIVGVTGSIPVASTIFSSRTEPKRLLRRFHPVGAGGNEK